MGDLVIVTLEGDDPGRSFAQLMTGTDEFSKWFGERAMAVTAISQRQPRDRRPNLSQTQSKPDKPPTARFRDK